MSEPVMTSLEREPLGQRPELLRMTRIGKTFRGGVKARLAVASQRRYD